MHRALLRAFRVTVFPGDEWRAIKDEAPRASAIITRFVLPLALIPAAGWGVGLLLFGHAPGSGPDSADAGIGQIVNGGLIAYFGVVLSICLCAVSIVALAPLFACMRDWSRALQVAAYSAAPVLIGGLVLVQPNLASILILAFFHSLYLQYAGLATSAGGKRARRGRIRGIKHRAADGVINSRGGSGQWAWRAVAAP